MIEQNNNSNDLSSPFGGQGPRIIIAGGGTGGHIFPAIAIANALLGLRPHTEILFVGAKGKMEMDKVPQAGYKIEGLDIAGYNRSSLIKNISLPFKLVKSFLQVRRILKSFKPDAVIGVGGYSSFPVLRFAQSVNIKSFIHESNSFAGKTNILLGKKATRVFVAGGGMERFFPPEKILITGNPVRESISKTSVTKEDATRFFGLDPYKKTILSVGGSLGAKSINESVAAHLGLFEENDLQLIWQTGTHYVDKGRHIASGKTNIWINDFITQMEYAYVAADVVISRSGAMSIAELCVMKKAAVLVPYPFAAEDHQTANAIYLVNKKAALMISDREVFDKLIPTVIRLSKQEQEQEELKRNIGTLAILNADKLIAAEIIKLIEKQD